MTNLTDASTELFKRGPDECYDSLQSLWDKCYADKEAATDQYVDPMKVAPIVENDRLVINVEETDYGLNDWSFGQLCRLARVSKDTINRLQPYTAATVLSETLPGNGKPLQLHTLGEKARAIHGTSYTRLYNSDLLAVVREFATDFQPPQTGLEGRTGLYCGEQDMFCFLIDPTGWAEINGEAFAPGFFVWNSEVGRRSIGVKTFWFQKVCQNHIVWDATEVVEFTRKHTANVHDALRDIREIIARLVEKRDDRRDAFVNVIGKAMTERLGSDADDVMKVLQQQGITRGLAKDALAIAEAQGAFTIFAVVDALTRLTGRMKFAGDRAEADQKAGSLLALVA